MNALEYDYSDEFERSVNEVLYACFKFFIEIGEALTEFERSVNEVLYACFKFFIEIGEALTDEDIEDIEEMIDNADC